MNDKEFKAGDKVYYPNCGTEIYELQQGSSSDFPLEIKDIWQIFRRNGSTRMSDMTQFFHATEENCELLSKLYGVEFEKPELKPTPSAVVKKMLNAGCAYVICNILLPNKVVKDIIRGHEGIAFIGESDNYYYDEIVPLDSYTGKVIVDYREGKPVLEDE